jgi:hypothetical protein
MNHFLFNVGMILFILVNISAITWDEIRVENTWPALCGVSRTLAAHREQKNAVAGSDLDAGCVTHRPV